jgi:hypothetical protein
LRERTIGIAGSPRVEPGENSARPRLTDGQHAGNGGRYRGIDSDFRHEENA